MQLNIPEYIRWLVDTGNKITLADGREADVWLLKHEKDDIVLSLWAKHFRCQYCSDDDIDLLRNGTGLSRKDYLKEMVFPDSSNAPGPSVRSGDFGEILVADYLEYINEFWVPRTRYKNKINPNESPKGSDVIGFKIEQNGQFSPNDQLAIYEVKSKFTAKCSNRLQDAVDDSKKDQFRKAVSLNALKRVMYVNGQKKDALRIERFQDIEDHPYKEIYGAAAIFTKTAFDNDVVSETDTREHPNRDNLRLLVIYGEDMMKLVHDLYRRAADEA